MWPKNLNVLKGGREAFAGFKTQKPVEAGYGPESDNHGHKTGDVLKLLKLGRIEAESDSLTAVLNDQWIFAGAQIDTPVFTGI